MKVKNEYRSIVLLTAAVDVIKKNDLRYPEVSLSVLTISPHTSYTAKRTVAGLSFLYSAMHL